MRLLLSAVGIAALGWGAHWYVGAQAMDRGVQYWLDERRDEGWLADVANVETRGFPNRFDTTLTGVRLADPDTGVAWTAPFFQILSLSYRPNHVIAVLPKAHTLASPAETIEFLSSDSKGSLVFQPDTNLALNRTSFETLDLTMTSTKGWAVDAREVRLATRLAGDEDRTYDLALIGQGLVPGGDWSAFAHQSGLPREIAELKVDATIGFTEPWDLRALQDARPQPVTIDLKVARAEWGELLFQAAGSVEVDRTGSPTGSLAIQARNWQEMVNLGITTGAIPVELLGTIESALGMLAGLSGNPDHIDAKLNFRNGYTMIAGIPVGPAPNLSLR